MKKIHLSITGLGNVGIRLLELIEQKRETIRTRYNLDFAVTGICDSSGAVINSEGLELPRIITLKKEKKRVTEFKGSIPGMGPAQFVEAVQADMLVELTLTNLKDGEPGLSAIRAALSRKWNVVTANKGPLVIAYSELADLAKSNGVRLLHSASVTGGLPTLNIGARDLGVTAIHRVEGIFNGTTNYILTRMAAGESFAAALSHAQHVGMAEADPSLDVDGWDAACKLVIIANAVLRRSTKLSDVSVEGIRSVTAQQLETAAFQGQVIKLIALAERKGSDYEFSVRPASIERTHPLASIHENMMGVIYHTDINGTIYSSIVEPDPYPTAAAVLRDIVDAVRNGMME